MGDLIFFIYVFAGEGEESAQGDSPHPPTWRKGLHFISLDVTSLQLFACHVICAL